MCLYESQVWRAMITYGGIILSFIKMVGVEQHPAGHVCVCSVRMHAWTRMCARLRSASPPKDLFRGIWSVFPWGEKEWGRWKRRKEEGMFGIKNLWAFKRLLPYCFETIQSDISYVALEQLTSHRPSNKGLWEREIIEPWGRKAKVTKCITLHPKKSYWLCTL